MNDEDLDEWQAFLRFTVDRALDYGVDSVAVVDQIASVLSEQRSLGPPSSTRVADLLLSNLDIADARSLPSAVFDLTNNTLLSNYPPKPHGKVPSLWLLRTLTRAIDACPSEFVQQLLETLQDGLCQWIHDAQSTLTEDEYGMDVLPMYQTALVSMMSLPARTVTPGRLSPLIDSAFCGREDKPEGAVPAFLEFWQSGYAALTEPADGWADKIVHCLEVVGLRPIEESESQGLSDAVDDDASEDEEVESQLLLQDADDTAVSPIIPSPRSLAEAFVLSPIRSPSPRKPNTLQPPPTPTAPTRVLTPPRPHKSVSPVKSFGPLLFSGLPSRSPRSSPTRLPTTPKRRTSGSARPRQEGHEKENTSPLRDITSIAERIAMRSPGPTLSVLGKRRFDADDETSTKDAHKKAHKDLTHIFGETLQNSHLVQSLHANTTLIPAGPSSSVVTTPVLSKSQTEPNQVVTSTETLHKRISSRKGVFMEAVEVPTYSSIRARRTRSAQTQAAASSSLADTLPQPRSLPLPPPPDLAKPPREASILRRTRSVTKMLRETAASDQSRLSNRDRPAPPPPPKSAIATGKRKRTVVDFSDDHYSLTSSLSSPIRRLKEMETMGSGKLSLSCPELAYSRSPLPDDSITLATPSLAMTSSASLSSDDDPYRYIGQVTPHRVVSPAIRRMRTDEFLSEPGSDDSNMSASPTTERVARMKRFAKPSPLKLRSRLGSRSP